MNQALKPDKKPRPGLLARQMSYAYSALIIYISLHPFSNWSDPGLPLFFFLDAAWPRYWTAFDLIVNALAYLPLGFLLTLAWRRLPGAWTSACVAFVLGSLLSLSVESIQAYLPGRVSSNLDLLCNAAGSLLGALLARWKGRRFFDYLALMQRAILAPMHHVEFGLILVSLWLLTQLSPETLLFGAGDLRHLLPITPALAYAANSFFALETSITVLNMIAIGLISRSLLAGRWLSYLSLCVFFVFALGIRTLGAAILLAPQQALAWLTPGALLGLLMGSALLATLLFLPNAWRLALAGLALMSATILVNLTPPNPYSLAALSVWQQGHFLNFNGLTRLVASIWPFLALPYLGLIGLIARRS